MKICLAAQGEGEDSFVSQVSARAPYFLIYENKELIETVKNPFLGGGGAGYSVAQLMANKGIELFVSGGQIGPVLKMTLEQKNIKMKTLSIELTIKKAVEEI